MKHTSNSRGFKSQGRREIRQAIWFGCLCVLLGPALVASGGGSTAAGRVGRTFYVSKWGDNSDGAAWATAFHTIQAALAAVPDAQGGHRIIVRPDTYMEANLFPAHPGAAGAYNELVGDFDGRLGSGTTGWVVIDSGDPQRGFKSQDWWSTIRAYKHGWSAQHQAETFSAIGWDRWTLRRLYATGADAGLFFDLVDRAEPFSVRVEDCVSLGRAFGGGVANVRSRPGEPSVFRGCQLWCLDWWGDAAGAYVRAEHSTPPPQPDVVFEDCTLVGPDNALQAGNPGYHGYTRVALKRCQLIGLNFSQPQGKPGTGIIHSTVEGKLLHVDLEDCNLMGCRVFGAGKGEVNYTVRGDVKAYVQFQQGVPAGMLRLTHWPVAVIQTILPPRPPARQAALRVDEPDLGALCEAAPVIWQDRLALMKCVRPATGGTRADYRLVLEDVASGRSLASFAEGHGLASALVVDGVFYAFASRFTPEGWSDVTLFQSSDLKHWDSKVVIEEENEHLFNSSVCPGPEGYVMAYESNDPRFPAFTIKFATSPDLIQWTKLPAVRFGADRYAACPCLRYVDGWYYLLYLEHREPRWFFETCLARSRDLKHWHWAGSNPVLSPGLADGINASDPDLIEFAGKTHLYYSVGDQRTWSRLKRATYPGSLGAFLRRAFESPNAMPAADR